MCHRRETRGHAVARGGIFLVTHQPQASYLKLHPEGRHPPGGTGRVLGLLPLLEGVQKWGIPSEGGWPLCAVVERLRLTPPVAKTELNLKDEATLNCMSLTPGLEHPLGPER